MVTILWCCNMFSPACLFKRPPMGTKQTKNSHWISAKKWNWILFHFVNKNTFMLPHVHFWVCVFISCFNKPLMVSFRCFWMNLHCVDTRSFIEMSAGLLDFLTAFNWIRMLSFELIEICQFVEFASPTNK